jgi:hypothetical protein
MRVAMVPAVEIGLAGAERGKALLFVAKGQAGRTASVSALTQLRLLRFAGPAPTQ